MLSIYASNGSVVEEGNLRKFFDVIVKNKAKMAIRTAAIVYENGNIASKTNKFHMLPEDLLEVKRAFFSQSTEKLSYSDVTYCIKSKTANQIVAFNGANYIIISKTNVTFIIVTCSNKQKSSSLAKWVDALAKMLRDRRT